VVVKGGGDDADGFLIVVDASIERPLMPTAPTLLSGLLAGRHEAVLEGVAPNCALVDSAAQEVEVTAGDTTRAVFEVTCTAAAGALRLTVQTTGNDLDPNGYSILVDHLSMASVEPDGATVLTVPAGRHMIGLDGVNSNCLIAEPTSRHVTVPIGGLGTAEFAIQCSTAARAGRGHEVAYVSIDLVAGDTTLFVVNDDGTHRERLFPDLQFGQSTPAWAPDGNRIAFYGFPTDSTVGLTIIDLDGGAPLDFAADPILGREAIAWAPDGSQLAIGTFFTEPSCPTIRVLVLDISAERPLEVGCHFDGIFESFAWSPDGSRLAFVVNVLVDIDLGTELGILAVAEVAKPGEDSPALSCQPFDVRSVSWSPDGLRLAVASNGEGIFLLDLSSGSCTRLTEEASDDSPTWSPDGTRIGFSSSRDGNPEIYVMNADGSAPMRLTRGTTSNVTPSWRP
jgi:TolB protein